jgi:hypothetical protein
MGLRAGAWTTVTFCCCCFLLLLAELLRISAAKAFLPAFRAQEAQRHSCYC